MQEERMISYRKKRKDEYIYRGTKERKKEKEDVKAMPVTRMLLEPKMAHD